MNLIRAYAERGWHVLPCWPRSKKAALKYDQASADPAVIEAWAEGDLVGCDDEKILASWMRQHRRANWAILCGPRSGPLVIDVESMDGHGELVEVVRAAGAPMPGGSRASTGGATGSGYHLYLRHPDRELVGHLRLGDRVEVRGARHLVLAPPSVHPDTGHRRFWERGWTAALPEAPSWLVERMIPPPPVERKPVDLNKVGEAYVRAAIARELEALSMAAEGGRNHALNRAAFNLLRPDLGLDPVYVRDLLCQQARDIGLPERESVATIRSAARAREVVV